ncbi:hypothetical protein HBI56_073190 [Parastagonospora nodorum]|uniref:Uncharacterized protein n=1 Tax=Phaeosphaeria nodorum (strain SN15 / ATCC MYA-4574 / FGSC 10173) TaxID=321614 RepID=A0A7U2EWR7_PHANO|nr:hypothetical protein HBH56_171800 [Parastagonospora nodorum]QRC94553.1 hypothetical protein JI435_305580 [Parastagonospora nodorum SN15]KAH3928680.1 hypothetical protein HBH54_140360 [Parastagonospora nodorum]KAH3945291.1 hypothetical protein HBH53_145680 [Parastagonospora nodorum]KAH3983808.1 hypothetical protein HBH52_058510 [Parastagonospora nodorum]
MVYWTSSAEPEVFRTTSAGPRTWSRQMRHQVSCHKPDLPREEVAYIQLPLPTFHLRIATRNTFRRIFSALEVVAVSSHAWSTTPQVRSLQGRDGLALPPPTHQNTSGSTPGTNFRYPRRLLNSWQCQVTLGVPRHKPNLYKEGMPYTRPSLPASTALKSLQDRHQELNFPHYS